MTGKVINESYNRITNNYGNGHNGVDLGWRSDENQNKIFSHSEGKVVVSVDGKDAYPYNDNTLATYGNYVEIDHGNGYKTRYAHLRKNTISVNVGQQVTASTQIGIIGESGYVKGRHLHFEVFKDGIRINPEPYLNQEFEGNPPPILNGSYQSHDSKYGWNPNVSLTSYREYAGNFGYNVDGIYLDIYNLRVHDMVKNQWLPWVSHRNDYAGNLGNAIDAIQCSAPFFKVHIKNVGWTEFVSSGGICGTYGKPIDAVQISSIDAS